ncbi:unnamed protein product, partial [Vitis vinifera]
MGSMKISTRRYNLTRSITHNLSDHRIRWW